MKKSLSNYVSFKLLNKDDEVLNDYPNKICFALIMKRAISKDVTKIIVYSEDTKTAYSPAICKKWIKLIKSFGFDIKYEFNKEDKIHNVIIPLTKENRNIERSYLASLLNFARCLTEGDDNGESTKGIYCYELVSLYFKLEKELNLKTKDDKFQLFQYIHQLNKSSINHRIRDNTPQKCLSLAEFKKRVNSNKTSLVYNFDTMSISELWQGNRVPKRQCFNAVRSKKYMNVLVVGGELEHANWLPVEVKFVKKLEDAELVIFTGGEDLSPSVYGEKKGVNTYCNTERDNFEVPIFKKAVEMKIPIVSICRGAQLTCALSGGRLVQHQQNRAAIHPIETNKYGTINVTSTHHQAQYVDDMKPWEYKLIGWTTNDSAFHLDGDGKEMNPKREADIVYYPGTNALGLQNHPEYKHWQKAYPKDLKVIQQIFTDFIKGEL